MDRLNRKYEVVPESEYTDFSDRKSGSMFVTVATAATTSLATYAITTNRSTNGSINTMVEQTSTVDPTSILINIGIGYVVVQMSPILINALRHIGAAL